LLLPKGYTSKSEYDQAQAQLRSSQSSHAAAQAQLANARDMLAYTELKASADGVITERQAEAGQVVQATVPIFTLARAGERDAVFDVYESLFNQELAEQPITVALLDRPAIQAQGKVREITPTIDAQSGTVKVKVELQNAPAEMNLGAVVTATVHPKTRHRVVLPWSALFKSQQQPAVWLVDEQHTVSLQPVSDVAYGSGTVMVGQGLQAGQQVVVAGGQMLHPGQQVEIATPEKAAEPEKTKLAAPPQEAKP
jgi:RND family efflux transporter MFP subunit